MKIKKASFLFMACMPLLSWANFDPTQSDGEYKVQIDLTHVVDDEVKVEMVVPIMRSNEAIYQLPAMVPGTYKVYDFGQFVQNLVALNTFGDTLKVERLNTNQWKIEAAKSLYKITYWVKDSYDEAGVDIFAPGGTSIGEKSFLLNNYGYVGYLKDYKDLPFTYQVKKPAGFYGTTSLPVNQLTDSLDVFKADNYFQLHDCPILYAVADTASVMVANAKIVVGVYSPEGHLKAKEILEGIAPVFNAAAEYLGGDLPTNRYSVLVYGMTLAQLAKGVGALEHHTSTVVNMPDIEEKFWKLITADGGMIQMMRDIVSHEFFHIVTPLSIHAKQINDFDFMNPQMSEHLWLYEGITEYNANISQVRSGVLTEEQFFNNMHDKMKSSHGFNEDIPFTVTSKFALSFFENEYLNVYQKGALIGMCLDLQLRSETDGKYGLPQLLNDLSSTFGKDTFFLDEQLFDIIAEVSGSPSIREFFARHVEGAQPLPYKRLLDQVGYDYKANSFSVEISTGGLEFRQNGDDIIISGYRANDLMTKEMGYKRGDILVEWNGQKITKENLVDVFAEFTSSNASTDDKVSAVVMRNVDGKLKKMKLKGKVHLQDTSEKDKLTKRTTLTEQEAKLKKAWLNL